MIDKKKKEIKSIDYTFLTEDKLQILDDLRGNILVNAIAGSGKTTLIEYAVMSLLEDNIDASKILFLTYTRNGAKVMLERVNKKLKEIYKKRFDFKGGTFHSIAKQFFEKYSENSEATLLSEVSQFFFIKKCIDLSIDDDLKNTDNYYSLNPEQEEKESERIRNNSYFTPEIFRTIRSKILLSGEIITKETIKNILEILNPEMREECNNKDNFKNNFLKIDKIYEDRKRKQNRIDFDDWLIEWNELLEFDEKTREDAKQFKYIFVDEYQDTNLIQDQILQKLSELNNNNLLLCCGDDAQCIFSFGGADISNFIDFQKNYENAKVYTLSYNCRSSQAILNIAEDSINHNETQLNKKTLNVYNSTLIPNKKPVFIIENNPASEAVRIYTLIKESLEKKESIAVLFRSINNKTNLVFNPLLKRLEEDIGDIPFYVKGGRTLFNKDHILDIFAFLSFRYNPQAFLSEAHLERISKYVYGMREIRAKRIYQEIIINQSQQRTLFEKEINYFKTLTDPNKLNKIRYIGKKTAFRFAKMMNVLFSLEGPPSKRIRDLMANKIFLNEFERIYKTKEDTQNYEDRKKDLDKLIKIIEKKNVMTLGEFVQKIEFYTKTEEQKEKENAVMISTIHQAKGCSKTTIIIPNLMEGFFPDHRQKTERLIEEERRIFYVAITRAIKNLYFTYSKRFDVYENKVSRFIEELSPELYEIENNSF